MKPQTSPHNTPHAKHKSIAGFTLVELSIVLVILGLLVGGVLAGQSMIESAESRAVITQMNQFTTAATTFRDKYLCLPGDCANATAFNMGGNGNGDGLVGCGGGSSRLTDPSTTVMYCGSFGGMSNTVMVRSSGESSQFWTHLAWAGLIAGQYTANPGGNVSAAMDSYFPKFATQKGYLHVLSWNGTTYIRSGIFGTDGSGNPWTMNGGALNGGQALHIINKLGLSAQGMMEPGCIGTSLCAAAPPMLFKSQMVLAGAEGSGGPAGGYFYISPNYSSPSACINNNAGTYTVNISARNNCNVMWKVY